MVIINKVTLETLTPTELSERTPHVLWDFSDEVYLRLMLQDSGYDLVSMPAPPMFDHEFFTLIVVNARKEGQNYVAEWELTPLTQTIEVVAQKKLKQIKHNCDVEIVGGFHSDALGESYFYSSDAESQANIQGNVLYATIAGDTKHVCYSSDGTRLILPHTTEQITQVGRDFSLHLWEKLEKYHTLRTQIETALSLNQLETLLSISWN